MSTATAIRTESLQFLAHKFRSAARASGSSDHDYDDPGWLTEKILDELQISGQWERGILFHPLRSAVANALRTTFRLELDCPSSHPPTDSQAPGANSQPIYDSQMGLAPRAKLKHQQRHGGAVSPAVQKHSQAGAYAPVRVMYDWLSVKILEARGRRWGDLTVAELEVLFSHHDSREKTARLRKDTWKWSIDRLADSGASSLYGIPRAALEPLMPEWLRPVDL